MARKWFRESEDLPPLFLAIGINSEGDGFLKVSERHQWAIWDIELSIDERIGLLQQAAAHGWKLDEPLY